MFFMSALVTSVASADEARPLPLAPTRESEPDVDYPDAPSKATMIGAGVAIASFGVANLATGIVVVAGHPPCDDAVAYVGCHRQQRWRGFVGSMCILHGIAAGIGGFTWIYFTAKEEPASAPPARRAPPPVRTRIGLGAGSLTFERSF